MNKVGSKSNSLVRDSIMKTVEDILMVKGPDVLVIDSDSTVLEAAELMARANVGSVIVREGGSPVGIFTERDLLRRIVAQHKDPASILLSTVMSSPVKSCRLTAFCTGFYLGRFDLAVDSFGSQVSYYAAAMILLDGLGENLSLSPPPLPLILSLTIPTTLRTTVQKATGDLSCSVEGTSGPSA